MRSDPTRGSRQALNLTPASVRPARSQLQGVGWAGRNERLNPALVGRFFDKPSGRVPPICSASGGRGECPDWGKSRQTSTIRKGSIAPIPARCPPGPLWRNDRRVSLRAPALRPLRVRAVLGRLRGARPATEPTHGDATAGQDPRRRRQDIARRQQPRDEGVLSGAVAV